MKTPLPNTYWVRPGLLLAGEHPWQTDEATTIDRLRRLQQAGIDCFLDLTEADERPDYQLLLPDDVRYQRCPLVDHDVPASHAVMASIIDLLAQQLAEDRGVYVHCKAGIGRTGMTMACHFIAGGEPPAVALERLNRLWKENERSRLWPRVPETPRQTEFVLQWQPSAAARPGAAAAADSREDRLRDCGRGMLLGGAVGDAFSVPLQGHGGARMRLPTELVGGGEAGLPPGAWTDDTSVLRCVADSLLQPGGFDARHALSLLQRWSRDGHLTATGRAVGIRPSLARAVARAGWRRGALTGVQDPKQRDADPLSRCAPVALRYRKDVKQALRVMDEVTGLTHQGGVVRDACRVFACLLIDAMAADSPAELLAGSARWRAVEVGPEVAAVTRAWSLPSDVIPPSAEGGGVVHALDSAVRGALGARDFASGVMRCASASAGGDVDVATSAAGALLGAVLGEAAIPATWRATLLQAVELRNLADRLLQDPA